MMKLADPQSILVIDDDPDMRQLLTKLLVDSGYRVIEAPSGEAGIDAAEAQHVDAVIVDKELPGMNGFDVLSSFGRRWPSVPTILITAFGSRQDADESRRRGAWFFIEKPFRAATVIEAVHSVLERFTS
jgi:DNA-binding NtrC family response regulator